MAVSAIPSHDAGSFVDHSLVKTARMVMELRRQMAKHFPKDTFHDEAWDVLLELYVSTAKGVSLCVKQALLPADMSATSAMRLLERLEAANLIAKSRSSADRRQTIVSFTERGLMATSAMLRDFANRSFSGAQKDDADRLQSPSRTPGKV